MNEWRVTSTATRLKFSSVAAVYAFDGHQLGMNEGTGGVVQESTVGKAPSNVTRNGSVADTQSRPCLIRAGVEQRTRRLS